MICVRLPREAGLRVVRDGAPVHEARGAALDADVGEPGRCRVEGRINGRVWLLSNPVTCADERAYAGHKVPDHDDDRRNIAETRQYLRDFIRLDETTDSPRELFDAMIELYPDRVNRGSLWGGANAAKREADAKA